MSEMLQKLTSRKFWMAAAAFLASFGTGIAGIANGNEVMITVGGVCTVLSAAIYTASEAVVDAARLKASTTTTNITATSTSAAVVEKALNATTATTATEEK